MRAAIDRRREVAAIEAADRVDRHARALDRIGESVPAERRDARMRGGRFDRTEQSEIHTERAGARKLGTRMARRGDDKIGRAFGRCFERGSGPMHARVSVAARRTAGSSESSAISSEA